MTALAILGAAFFGMSAVVTVAALRFVERQEGRRPAGATYCKLCAHSEEWTHNGKEPHLRCTVLLERNGKPGACGSVNKKRNCEHYEASGSEAA